MPIDFIDGKQVRALLSLPDCIDLMSEVMVALSKGQAVCPMRQKTDLPERRGQLLTMPGAILDPAVFGAKLVSLYPQNVALGRPAVQGLIVLFDLETGAPTAVVDAASITAMRTAAASGLATKYLARPDAHTLVLLGYGVQAQTHLEAMLAVRPIDRVLVWGRSSEKAELFAKREREKWDIAVEACAHIELAVEQADIICTLTNSPIPIVKNKWVQPGTHLNLVGAHTPTTREVDTKIIQQARVYVETRAAALTEAGDIIIPLQNADITEAHIKAEIGEVILDKKRGRRSHKDITLYKSLGNSAQDLAAANAVLVRMKTKA